jgi:pilus assembly protein CpaE
VNSDVTTAVYQDEAQAEAMPQPDALAPEVPGTPLVTLDGLAFVNDEHTYQAIASVLGPDAQSRVAQGGIEHAVAHLTQAACPRMMVVDISTVQDPMGHVDALAEVCEPGTVVIAIGSVNDINLFRQLTDAGVMDYLVKPLTPQAFQTSIQKAHAQLSRTPIEGDGGKVTMFVGARSGTGTSTLAMNAATVLAKEMGQKVALVDLDLQFGTVALLLDVEAGNGLREILENPSRIDSMFLSSAAAKVHEKLFVLAAEEGLTGGVDLDPEAVAEFLSELRMHFDHIVVDVPPSIAVKNWKAIGEATHLVVVSDLTLFGLRDTMRMLTAARTVVEDNRLTIAVNRVGAEKSAEVDRKNFEKTVDHKINVEVPDDRKSAIDAVRSGKPVVETAAKSKMASAIRGEICKRINPEPVPEDGKKKRKK